MISRQGTLQAGRWAGGLMVANALILWSDSLLLKAIAAILLYSLLQPALASSGTRYPGDAVELGSVTIQ